jgi:hypothetical protein
MESRHGYTIKIYRAHAPPVRLIQLLSCLASTPSSCLSYTLLLSCSCTPVGSVDFGSSTIVLISTSNPQLQFETSAQPVTVLHMERREKDHKPNFELVNEARRGSALG